MLFLFSLFINSFVHTSFSTCSSAPATEGPPEQPRSDLTGKGLAVVDLHVIGTSAHYSEAGSGRRLERGSSHYVAANLAALCYPRG